MEKQCDFFESSWISIGSYWFKVTSHAKFKMILKVKCVMYRTRSKIERFNKM